MWFRAVVAPDCQYQHGVLAASSTTFQIYQGHRAAIHACCVTNYQRVAAAVLEPAVGSR